MARENQKQVLGQRNFARLKEDFKCRMCGTRVKGTGYTNHCPECLWSMHTDRKPGDRSENCKGIMKPLSATYNRSYYTIVHQCLRCGARRQVKASENDNKDIMEQIMKPGPLVI